MLTLCENSNRGWAGLEVEISLRRSIGRIVALVV